MDVEMRRTEEITPYEQNPRLNDDAVQGVAESIQQFGWRQPIVVDVEGVIVVGHARWKAAKKLGLAEVPVHVARDLSPEKARAYRIADNKSAEASTWDYDLLPIELAAVQESGLDLSSLGFSDDELAEMLSAPGAEGLTDPEDVPAPPDDPVTRLGDLWLLGNHRLLCGDSGDAKDLARLLDGAVIDLVHMDPPYNVKVEPRSNNAIAAGLSSFPPAGQGSGETLTHHQSFDAARRPGVAHATTGKLRPKDRPLANDFVSDADFASMLRAWFQSAARALKPGGSFYVWGGYANLANYPAPLKAAGLYFSQALVWDKQHPVLTRKDFMGAFELAFYGWKEGAAHHFYGPDNVTDLWHVKKVSPQKMVHLTEKPAELALRAVQYSSRPGEKVLDLFGGSGSTLIACEQAGRHACLMEIDPPYCDVIVQRWEAFTGRKAQRIAQETAGPVAVEAVER